MSLYALSWTLLERWTCPADPAEPCGVVPDANLRPCSECLHCHDRAQEIENALSAAYRAGKAGLPESEVKIQ